MKDIKSFCKLFDLNVPSYENIDYYKNQYSKLPRWSNIDKLQTLYEEVETEISDVFEYKINKTNQIIDFHQCPAMRFLCWLDVRHLTIQ